MNPFIGQIVLFAGNFAPRGWAFCHGQLLPISTNTALFSLFGTTFGGDGRTTFGLPDYQGRMAISQGHGPGLPTYNLGQKGGNASTKLSVANLPQSQIYIPCSDDDPTSAEPGGMVMSLTQNDTQIYNDGTSTPMKSGSILGATNAAFSNQSPVLAMNYIVALVGTYPSRS